MTLDRATVDARIRGERNRALANIEAETERPKCAYWLSFAGEEGFRGAVIVHANEFFEAITRAHLLGINPGGECQSLDIPPETASLIPEHWKQRLLNREECAAFDAEMKAKQKKDAK